MSGGDKNRRAAFPPATYPALDPFVGSSWIELVAIRRFRDRTLMIVALRVRAANLLTRGEVVGGSGRLRASAPASHAIGVPAMVHLHHAGGRREPWRYPGGDRLCLGPHRGGEGPGADPRVGEFSGMHVWKKWLITAILCRRRRRYQQVKLGLAVK
jgi:hypothetical protein